MFCSIGIPRHWIRNISFIGKSISEIITFEDKKEIIISKLDNYMIKHLENYNPLSITNLKDEKKFTGLSTERLQENAHILYISRLQHIITRIPDAGQHRRLKNYLNMKINRSIPEETTVTQPKSPSRLQTTVVTDEDTLPINVTSIKKRKTYTVSGSSSSSETMGGDLTSDMDTGAGMEDEELIAE